MPTALRSQKKNGVKMSQLHLEERVGHLEREQVRQGVKIDALAVQMTEVTAGIKTLVERDAKRPDWSLSKIGSSAAMTIAIVAGMWAFTNWIVEHSSVVDLLKREQYDMKKILEANANFRAEWEKNGRLFQNEKRLDKLEKRIEEIEAWRPIVVTPQGD